MGALLNEPAPKRREPVPGPWERRKSYDFATLRFSMGSYKRAKHASNQVQAELDASGARLKATAAVLGFRVDLEDLSAYDSDGSE